MAFVAAANIARGKPASIDGFCKLDENCLRSENVFMFWGMHMKSMQILS